MTAGQRRSFVAAAEAWQWLQQLISVIKDGGKLGGNNSLFIQHDSNQSINQSIKNLKTRHM